MKLKLKSFYIKKYKKIDNKHNYSHIAYEPNKLYTKEVSNRLII